MKNSTIGTLAFKIGLENASMNDPPSKSNHWISFMSSLLVHSGMDFMHLTISLLHFGSYNSIYKLSCLSISKAENHCLQDSIINQAKSERQFWRWSLCLVSAILQLTSWSWKDLLDGCLWKEYILFRRFVWFCWRSSLPYCQQKNLRK